MKKCMTAAAALTLLAATACGSGDSPSAEDDTITLGFSQVGAESGWRTANTESVQQAAEDAGIDLQFSDAQQKQENQIRAIRSFVQQNVDVIAFSPVVETGWDAVLLEAQRADIPVILTDRAIDSEDDTLYETFLGSDFVEEGRKAGEWLVDNAEGETNVVELQGTTGAAPAIDRKEGFEEVIADHPDIEVIATQTGDFTRSGGKEVMEAFLRSHDDIDVVYAHNDDMGLGAIEAIRAAGMEPGEDIQIITVDAVQAGMEALAEGDINFIVECNPLLGDQLMELVEQVVADEEVPKRIEVEETTFTQEEAQAALPDRKY
ncbi:ABC transporter substrate-binding protein [Nocardiopsis ganjiahuensis]|uniref:ABC transporter substrate-binding protein n=1 Tax=Nocardiopsis ganjiahuensis TaxID=239984 RepID=UPI000477CA9B|nr:ABC transporter substrate-binding protein [Nocardiopsis ganjiahuensis]